MVNGKFKSGARSLARVSFRFDAILVRAIEWCRVRGHCTQLSAGSGVAWWWVVGRGADDDRSASIRRRRVSRMAFRLGCPGGQSGGTKAPLNLSSCRKADRPTVRRQATPLPASHPGWPRWRLA